MTDETKKSEEPKSEANLPGYASIEKSMRYQTPHGAKDLTLRFGSLQVGAERFGKDTSPKAEVVYLSYRPVDAKAGTPIVFAFNGGPGSASLWLHLGLIGPETISIPDPQSGVLYEPAFESLSKEVFPKALSFSVETVLVDPPGTGLSLAKDESFFAVEKDAEICAEFIERYLSEHKRWASAVHLIGESYGAFRIAKMSKLLVERGIAVQSVSLISPALDLELDFDGSSKLPALTHLPTYAAVAAYHQRAKKKDVLQSLDSLRDFSFDKFLPALARGGLLTASESKTLREEISSWIGIAPNRWPGSDLSLDQQSFSNRLFENEGWSVGRLDGRFLSLHPAVSSRLDFHDPSYEPVLAAFNRVQQSILFETLGVPSNLKYEALSMKVNEAWKWDFAKPRAFGYPDAVPDLRAAMVKCPSMKVFAALGYYDLATPFFAEEIALARLGPEESIRKRVSIEYYEAGHMMYLHRESRERLATTLAAFIVPRSEVP